MTDYGHEHFVEAVGIEPILDGSNEVQLAVRGVGEAAVDSAFVMQTGLVPMPDAAKKFAGLFSPDFSPEA